VLASGSGFPLVVLAGTDDRGNYFGTGMMDAVAMGSGARSSRDGVDTGGATWSPLMKMLNIEDIEQFYPILYLYRQELPDSGGAGCYRGGVGMKFAFTPYRANQISVITNTGGMEVSTHGALGLFGGYPSPTCHNLVRKQTNLAEIFAQRRVPAAIESLESAEDVLLRGKSNGTVLLPGDVVEATFGGGGGYGDPLEREPQDVARDVSQGYVSARAAERVYGVAVESNGAVNEVATSARRAAAREERQRWIPASALTSQTSFTPATGEPTRAVHEYVVERDEAGRRVLACARCAHVLSDYSENYKHGLLVESNSVTLIPGVQDPCVFLDEKIELRRYCCPGCQILMATDIARAGEPVMFEMKLHARQA
jgi:N-methylhydantoinase B